MQGAPDRSQMLSLFLAHPSRPWPIKLATHALAPPTYSRVTPHACCHSCQPAFHTPSTHMACTRRWQCTSPLVLHTVSLHCITLYHTLLIASFCSASSSAQLQRLPPLPLHRLLVKAMPLTCHGDKTRCSAAQCPSLPAQCCLPLRPMQVERGAALEHWPPACSRATHAGHSIMASCSRIE